MAISIEEFENVFKSNHKRLCNLAYRIVNDRDSAEDIVQDVFYKLWGQRNEIQIETSIIGYLHKATTNSSLNFIESNNRFRKFQEETKSSIQSEETITQAISAKELESHIQTALHRLPPKCKAIFILSRFEGMRYKEIAGHFNISVNTVENQMVKALELMREELKPFLTKEFLMVAISIGISVLVKLLSPLIIALLFIGNF